MRKNNGITLVGLIVTIVVMLILVAVSINIIIKSDLIGTADKVAKEYNSTADIEEINKLNDWINSFVKDEGGIKLNFNGYVPDTWTNKDIIINLAMDEEKGEKYQYSNDKNAWTDCNSTITINTDQEKTYYFRRVDSNGNSLCETKGYIIKRDTEGPTFDLELTTKSGSITSKITNINDNGSKIEDAPEISIEYKKVMDDNYIVAYTGPQSEYTIDNLGEMFKDVIYVVKATIKDKANNEGKVEKRITVKSAEKNKDIDVSEPDYYKVSVTFEENYPEDVLELLNSGNFNVEDIINKYDIEETMSDYKKYTPITLFYELTAINGGVRNENGMYDVGLSIPSLTTDDTNLSILYYSVDSQKFKVVTANTVDYQNKTMKMSIEELPSAISIIKK